MPIRRVFPTNLMAYPDFGQTVQLTAKLTEELRFFFYFRIIRNISFAPGEVKFCGKNSFFLVTYDCRQGRQYLTNLTVYNSETY